MQRAGNGRKQERLRAIFPTPPSVFKGRRARPGGCSAGDYFAPPRLRTPRCFPWGTLPGLWEIRPCLASRSSQHRPPSPAPAPGLPWGSRGPQRPCTPLCIRAELGEGGERRPGVVFLFPWSSSAFSSQQKGMGFRRRGN